MREDVSVATPGQFQLRDVRIELLDHLHEPNRQLREARIAAKEA